MSDDPDDSDLLRDIIEEQRYKRRLKTYQLEREKAEVEAYRARRDIEARFVAGVRNATLAELVAGIQVGVQNGQCWQDATFAASMKELERRAKEES